MSKLVWDATGEHLYETGVKNGVLYVIDSNGAYPEGVVWNGLTGITEKPTGAETTALYADDQKYLNLISAEEFEATIEAYTYPDEFGQCDGSAELADGVMIGQQSRKTFGMCYRTVLGNDVSNDAYGYKLHIIYGAVASPSEKSYATVNDSPEAITFSWDVKTTPVPVTGHKPTASLTIDSTNAAAGKMSAIEAILFGAEAWSGTKTYAVGDIVEHESGSGQSAVTKAYKCNQVPTGSIWVDANWTEIAVAGPRLPLPNEINTIMSV